MNNTMTVISQNELGGPEVLHTTTVQRPSAGQGQILIMVKAAGINPTDSIHRRLGLSLGEPPFTLGWDVSGTVAEVGHGVTIFEVGDDVFGMLPYPDGVGAYAEYVVAPARAFTRKPVALTHVEAAALPLAGLVGWQALVETAHVSSGERALIHGASGGVGHLALQIAKALGLYVIATATPENFDLLARLGADEVFDYRDIPAWTAISPVDFVFDPAGGQTRRTSVNLLSPGGRLVSSIPDPEAATLQLEAAARGLSVKALVVEDDQDGTRQLARLAEEGFLRPVITATFPLHEASAAHAFIESTRPAGKVVLKIEAEATTEAGSGK